MPVEPLDAQSRYVTWRKLTTKRPGRCSDCGKGFSAGVELWWETNDKMLRCSDCYIDGMEKSPPAVKPDPVGTPGNSAAREYEARKSKYEAKVRREHPLLGELIIRFGEQPSQVQAWKKGQKGEQGVAEIIEELARNRHWSVLHDRRIPGTKANIDHLVINSAGVWVIDAKNYRGLVRQESTGGWLGTKENRRLFVGDRDCTLLVDGVNRQVRTVLEALAGHTPVTGVLAFYRAEWPWIGKPLDINGVLVNSRGLEMILTRQGALTPAQIEQIASKLAHHFPPA